MRNRATPMPDWISTLLDLLAQFTGGREPAGPAITWYGIAAAGWSLLLIVSLYRLRQRKTPRETLLVWAFAFGLGREIVMIGLKASVAFKVLDPVTAQIIYPPLEHMLQNFAMVVIAAAFIRFASRKVILSRNYLRAGLTLIAATYLATFWWWAAFIRANPAAKFGHTWCDLIFHSVMSALLVYAIVSLLAGPASQARNWVCGALGLFFIFEFLKIPDIATHEIHKAIYGPIRHGCYLLAIPMLGMVYIRELIAELSGTLSKLDASVAEKTRDLTHTLSRLEDELVERRRIESELILARDAALESTRMKSEFLATVSHEIRTPMNGVIGMANLLLETDLAADQAKFVRVISQSGDSLLTIIDDILDVSRIEAGRLKLETDEFNVRDLVDGVVIAQAYPAQMKGLEIAALIDAEAPDTLIGDETRIRQVLSNLIGNAIKFTDTGSILVRVRVEERSREGVKLRFAVSDTGIGISKDEQGRIFEAFIQADSANNRRYGGSGLGLAICQNLAKLMGGAMEVRSAPKKGSTFSFTALLRDAGSAGRSAIADARDQTRRALVVEPSRTLRDVLDSYLAEAGFTTVFALDDEETIEALTEAGCLERPFDFVFFDQEQDRFENAPMAQTLLQYCATSGSQPVHVVSSIDRADETERIEGVTQLIKPFSRDELFEIVLKQPPSPVASASKTPSRESFAPPVSEQIRDSARVLVVDDNPLNRTVARSQFECLGIAPDVVTGGLEAIAACREKSYDVVIMDCQMPEIDGFAATRGIRSLMRQRIGDLAASTQPYIIAMTANAQSGAREKCMDSGMNDYVSKPITKQKLAEVLARGLPGLISTTPKTVVASSSGRSEEAHQSALSAHLDTKFLRGEIGQIDGLPHIYLKDANHLLSKMRDSIDASDRSTLRSVAHGLAGSSAVLHLKAMTMLSKRLENMEESAPIADARGLLAQLETELGRLASQIA